MKNIITVVCISLLLLISAACDTPETKIPENEQSGQSSEVQPGDSNTSPDNTVVTTPKEIDLEKIKPNEAGKIMVVMFHNFVETFTPKPYDAGEYTTTFAEFRKLLQQFYDKGYRVISMKDYLDNNINVPAGYTPVVFTFDDGTAGQFNLVEENGQLVVNKNSAVGIMEEFYKEHPDFGLAGTFYVNLGDATFEGKGTLAERLKYLADKGFEIENHTYTHINLSQAKSAEAIIKEVGMNQKKIAELIPGYQMTTLSLPFGAASSKYADNVKSGEFEGVKYENRAFMLVGANPANPSIVKNFNPYALPRVRSNGIKPVECDLQWWMNYLDKNPKEQYISDGDANTVTVPESAASKIDSEKLNGRNLRTY